MKKIVKLLSSLTFVLALSVFGLGVNFAQAASYTSADVAAHNTASNCWVIINTNVYDLTSFIPIHPGGPAVITSVCGQNGTTLFNTGPHSSSTLSVLDTYLIGTLALTPVLTTINVTPITPSVVVGNTQTMAAATLDQLGAPFTTTILWSSSNSAVGTINPTTGLFTAIAAGTTTLTATSGAVSGSTMVTVTATPIVPVLTSVLVTPTSSSVLIGGTKQLIASPKDQNSTSFAGATTTFSSSNSAVASVNSITGLVTGVTSGSAVITATSVSGDITVTATSTITVTSTTPPSSHRRHHGHKDNDNHSNNHQEGQKENDD